MLHGIRSVSCAVALVALLTAGCDSSSMHGDADPMDGMDEMDYAIPAGMGWADGSEIRFAHTEASDSALAVLLTQMMSSPVLYVPSMAGIPDTLLAKVYVFSNGIAGMGPLDFQADVFNSPPPSTGYTPLRRLYVVTWATTATPRILTSESQVTAAESAGELTVEKNNVVINMPFISWVGSAR